MPGSVSKTCPECGSGFNCYPSEAERRTFCSHSCAATYRKREKHGENRVKLTCEWCETEFELPPSLAEQRGGRRFCSRECTDEWQRENSPTGSDHPTWDGGYWEDGHNGTFQRNRRKALRQAEKACEECGMSREEHYEVFGWDLEAHHVVKPKEYEGTDPHTVENLRILCRPCHRQAEAN